MKRLARILLLPLCLLAHVAAGRADTESACPPTPIRPTPEALAAAMRDARDHGFLWRLQKAGRTSYLYGTIHVARPEWMMPGPTVVQALRESDTVAVELDLMDPAVQAAMAEGMARLKHHPLPAALSARLRRQADAACLPHASLARMPPEMQVMTLSLVAGRWQGLDASYGIDVVLSGIGRGARKEVVSLESVETQLQVATMPDPRDTASFVETGLEQIESGLARSMIERFAQAWADSNDADLAHYERWCECMKTPAERAMMKRLLDDRNPGLARRIDELHSAGRRVFAAAGALHMFGTANLPALMAQRGYRVERVVPAAR